MQQEILESRNQNFKVEIHEETRRLPQEKLLRVTYNGYQYSSISFLPHEGVAIIKAIQKSLESK